METGLPAIESLLLHGLVPAVAAAAGPVLLTIVRFCGLVCTAPLISSPVVPWRLRIALAVTLGGCCGLGIATAPAQPIPWGVEVVWLALLELGLGAAIGFVAKLLLTGLELAAGVIDQQSGLGTYSLLHPEHGGDSSATAGGLAILAGMTWLLLAPLGGDLRIVAALLDSLRALPPGTLHDLESPVQLVRASLSAGCLFGLQVAAPVVVSVGLLQALWSALARSRGGALWQPALTPLRALLALLVLAATVTDLGDSLAGRLNRLFGEMSTVTVVSTSPVSE